MSIFFLFYRIKIYESFYDVLKYSNYEIIKCFKLIIDKNIITINFGSIIVILFFSLYMICLFIYLYRGIIPLKIQLRIDINNILKKFGFNNNKIFKSDISNILNPPLKRNSDNKLMIKSNLRNKRKRNSLIIINNISKANSSYMTRKNIVEKFPPDNLDNLKEIKVNNNINDSGSKYINQYDDYELNDLEYIDAINLDKRSLCQIYLATLKREHLIIFTFINCSDYNLLVIKLARFVFLIVGDMAFNVFFFQMIPCINYF